MRHLLSFIILSVMLILLVSCGSTTTKTDENTTALIAQSTSNIESISTQNIDLVSNTNNNFAFDLYVHMQDQNKNQFLSSYSLFSMLNILLPGAKGETRSQMLEVGDITIEEDRWERYFRALHAKTVNFLDANNSGFEFSFINSFWFQKGMQMKQEYLDSLQKIYGVDVKMVDFYHDSEHARQSINRWTKEITHDKIKELLSKDAVNESSKIVLVNAMYLKALWMRSFSKEDTMLRPFDLVDDNTVSVEMMHQINYFRYVKKDGVEMLCMRYKNSDFGLVSFLPEKGKFADFEDGLNNEVLDYFASDFAYTKLDLYYPKFEIHSDVTNIKEMLIEKGMVDAFDDSADFSGIDADGSLKISNIVQKMYFKIDEEGTEAATSTAISIAETDHDKAQTVRFNRPFIVMICHIPTRTVLFIGRVMNPLE